MPPPLALARVQPAKKKRKATLAEKMADLDVRCGPQVQSPAFRDGVEASLFPMASLRLDDAIADQCIVIDVRSEDRKLDHLLRIVDAGELQSLKANDSLDAWVASLKQIRPRLTLLVRGGTVSAMLQVTTHLQAKHLVNVRTGKTFADLGLHAGRIFSAIAKHLHESNEDDPSIGFSLEGAVAATRKKSGDAREQWTNMLEAIPGMSRTRAAAVVRVYPSMADLIAALKAGGPHAIQSVPCSDSGKTLGPALSEKVHTIFTSRDPAQIIESSAAAAKKKKKKKKQEQQEQQE